MTDPAFSPRIVDALVDAVLIVENQGRILYANPALGDLLGYPVDGLFGQPFVSLVPEPLRSGYWKDFHQLLEADPPRPSQAPRRITMRHADGSEMPIDVATFLVAPIEGPRLIVAVLWDVRSKIDIDRYQRVSDELLAFLAGATGDAAILVPRLLSILATSMDFEVATAWRWDPEAELLRCEHIWRGDETDFEAMLLASTDMTIRAGQGLAGLVVNSDQFIWLAELETATELNRHRAMVTDGLQTAFAFPIRARNRLVGVIELFTRSYRQPDAPLVDAVAEVCAKLGEFIERLELEAQRTELIVELERSKRHQEFLLRANRALAGARNFMDSVERLASVALPTLGDICLVDVVNANGKLQRLAAGHKDPLHQKATDELRNHSPDIAGSHPAALAIRTARSQWSSQMDDAFMRRTTQSDRHFELTQYLQFESYVSVPLLTEEGPIGALTVITAGGGHHFGNEELVLAETLASQVASVIERSRRFDEQSNISHLLQASLLPSRLGELPGISVAARHRAGSHDADVGGDFFDAIAISESQLALVIGDVEGHDMTAATAMGELRSGLRAYLAVTRDPGRVMTLLGEFAAEQASQRLATACLCILDVSSKTIEFASAGHPLPFLTSGENDAEQLHVDPGPPLGVGGGLYAVARLNLPSAGTLAFFTDGLIDPARADAQIRYGALAALMSKHRYGDTESLADSIVSELGPSTSGSDDLAVMVVQWSSVDRQRDSDEVDGGIS